jgi:TetR/AcrR family transcriptional regulator, regulator of biofilm formation and stress response
VAVTSPSGRRPRGAARREALLDAALRIVAEVGAHAVTHRRVAAEAGLPLASTTYHFDSKEHLLTAALERAAERDSGRLHAILSQSPQKPADPLGLVVDAILDPLEENDPSCRASLLATYALMLEAARRPALRDIHRRWTEAYIDALSRLLELAGSEDPRADAALLLAAADGLLVEQLASDRTAEVARQLRRLAAALVIA